MKHIHIPTIEELLRPDDEFGIEELPDGYRIRGVHYQHNYRICDVAKRLLPKRTQEVHARYAKNARPDQYRATCAPIIHAICKTLYQNREGKQKELVEKARRFFQKKFEYWLHTLTRVTYNPLTTDITSHEIEQPCWEYVNHTDIVGPRGSIKDTRPRHACHAILGDYEPLEINEVYKWITKYDTDLLRLENKPTVIEECPVLLNTFSLVEAECFRIVATEKPETTGCAIGIRWEMK